MGPGEGGGRQSRRAIFGAGFFLSQVEEAEEAKWGRVYTTKQGV